MPLDGSFIACLSKELRCTVDCHIDKIHMPAKNEFVFSLRGKNLSKKLFISISPGSPRVNFTDVTFENPANPPMFCMLLRKHLASGRILSLDTNGAERLINLKIQSTNEMGDRVVNTLILEFLGQKTNLILLDETGRILDAARRSDIESGDRIIQPGAIYSLPENTGKTDILEGDLTGAVKNILSLPDAKLRDALLQNLGGVSPLICREIAFSLTGDCDGSVCEVDEEKLLGKITEIKNTVISGGTPYILYDENSTPKDYSFTEIRQYKNLFSIKKADSYSALLEEFYGEKDRIRRLEHHKSDLVKKIKNLISRNERKLELRKQELKKSDNREHLRIYGELIKANIYRIPKGAHKIEVENYYDPECKSVEIPLNSKGKLDVGGAVGTDGFLTVIKDLNLKEPYIGQTPIITGEIAEDLTSYYAISEQLPSVCALGVLVNPDLSIKKAGGFIIQLLPTALDDTIDAIERCISDIPSVTQMLSDGMTPEEICHRVLSEFELEVLDESHPVYKCNCSRERVEGALISTGLETLKELELEEKTEVNCQFCDKKYVFSGSDIAELIKKAEK